MTMKPWTGIDEYCVTTGGKVGELSLAPVPRYSLAEMQYADG